MMVLYIDFELSLNMIYIHFEFKYDSVIHHSNHIFELSLNILLSHLLMLDIILTSCESVDSNILLCNLVIAICNYFQHRALKKEKLIFSIENIISSTINHCKSIAFKSSVCSYFSIEAPKKQN